MPVNSKQHFYSAGAASVQNSTAAEKQTPFLQETLTVPEAMVNLAAQERHKRQFQEALDCCWMYTWYRSISDLTQTWFGTGGSSLGMIVDSLFSTV